MAVVTMTSKGIARDGVDVGHTIRIADRLVTEQGFNRTAWVDYLTKKVDGSSVFLTIKKNKLHVGMHRPDGTILYFTATTPDRLKIRLDRIFQGEQK